MDTDKLKALALAASPGPWRGDRYDGTVKYALLDANGDPVIRGDNGNSDSGPFGIDSEEDEAYLLAANPATVLELIAEVERLRAEVREWLCIDCNTVYPGPPQPGLACVICPKCKGTTMPRRSAEIKSLKAELARDQSGTKSPEPHMDAAFEGGPNCAEGGVANSNSAEFDGIKSAAPVAGTVEKDVERYHVMRAQLSGRDLDYYRLEGEPESEIDAYCDAAIEAHAKAGKD